MTKFMTQEEFDALPQKPKTPKEYPTFMTNEEFENYLK